MSFVILNSNQLKFKVLFCSSSKTNIPYHFYPSKSLKGIFLNLKIMFQFIPLKFIDGRGRDLDMRLNDVIFYIHTVIHFICQKILQLKNLLSSGSFYFTNSNDGLFPYDITLSLQTLLQKKFHQKFHWFFNIQTWNQFYKYIKQELDAFSSISKTRHRLGQLAC